MSFFPASIARVPNALSSQLALGNITRTNVDLLRIQAQLASGKLVNKMSDDAVKGAAILELNNRLDRAGQLQRNIQHAKASLGMLDTSLGEMSDIANDGRGIASSQVGVPADGAQRRGQARRATRHFTGQQRSLQEMLDALCRFHVKPPGMSGCKF